MTNDNISVSDANFPKISSAPMLLSKEAVIFPYGITPLSVEERNLPAVKLAMEKDRLLAFFPEMPHKDLLDELPMPAELTAMKYGKNSFSVIGCTVRIVKHLKFPDGSVKILVRGLRRISCTGIVSTDGAPCANYKTLDEVNNIRTDIDIKARQKNIISLLQEMAAISPNPLEDLQIALLNSPTPSRMADMLSDAMSFAYPEKVLLLNLIDVLSRLDLIIILINREIEIMKLGMKIQNEVHMSMNQFNRENFLREQMRAIKNELNEDSRNPDIIEIEKRVESTELPPKVAEVIRKELERLQLIPQAAPEYHISYTYITWLLDVPWLTYTEDTLDCDEAAKILEADHYGLKDVKDRILEFLAVLQLKDKDNRKAPILCLVGPPGVGKTSLGQSIAKAMNRKFIRVSLGGVRDEAEIRGHRRTYVGALPGRIIQNMKKAGTANPVFMLDEIDKLANDFRGDPASALLEVLDPAQNHSFNDHYLELDYDLSKVFFIATANMLDTIPGPLRDRMEIIQISGYTSLEKREIARRYLVPRQLKENGLTAKQVKFGLGAIDEIIDFYTRESGVRQLERVVAQVCRRIGRKLVSGELVNNEKISVSAKTVNELLGSRKFLRDEAGGALDVGCATGMAWTSFGGVTLPIETVAVPGKGGLKLTGSLGKVMQESAETAFTLLKTKVQSHKINPDFFDKNDVHIHVPDGATPKDGPSAGVTLSMALLSLMTNRKLKPSIAMTGEITLTGKVTAVGGIREKVIAAMRAGVKTVLLPEENRKDAEELPSEIKDKMDIHFVKNFDQAERLAF